jgi:hypothetical protein
MAPREGVNAAETRNDNMAIAAEISLSCHSRIAPWNAIQNVGNRDPQVLEPFPPHANNQQPGSRGSDSRGDSDCCILESHEQLDARG